MAKRTPDASLKGKRPINKAKSTSTSNRPITRNPGHIRNKLKRSEMYGKYLLEKKARQKQMRLERDKKAEELGVDVSTVKQTPKTLDNTREVEITAVRPGDAEVAGDEAGDEFAEYFADTVRPKILVTTRPKPSSKLFYFIGDLMRFIPRLYYYPRKHFSVKQICEFAQKREFTHLMVLSEKSKVCNGMIISHLRNTGAAAPPSAKTAHDNDSDMDDFTNHVPSDNEDDDSMDNNQVEEDNHENQSKKDDEEGSDINFHCGGPTAFFKVSNVISSSDVPYHGSPTSHVPELVLNGFGTRLGHRVGRFLGSIFPHNAQFQGRQVATFHNQRDFIFVRHHRYVFEEGNEAFVEEKKDGDDNGNVEDSKGEKEESEENEGKEKKQKKKTKARLQELGPRFTLKLRWIQEGMFDTQFGEYEWYHKRKEMDTTRRKFHL